MIDVYGYMPAWGVPDISPHVTKLLYYLDLAKIEYKYHNQDLTKLDADAPHGKLPFIIDTDDGTKVADSNMIIEYLKKKYGDKLDQGMSKSDHAVALAFERLVGDNLYFSGVLEPRWRMDEGFEIYVPVLVQGAEVGPELRAFLEAFRARILANFDGQGMGRRDSATVLQFYKADIDALSDFLGDKKYLMGDKPHEVDARVVAMLHHFQVQPQKWAGSGYLESKQNLVNYVEMVKKQVKHD